MPVCLGLEGEALLQFPLSLENTRCSLAPVFKALLLSDTEGSWWILYDGKGLEVLRSRLGVGIRSFKSLLLSSPAPWIVTMSSFSPA